MITNLKEADDMGLKILFDLRIATARVIKRTKA